MVEDGPAVPRLIRAALDKYAHRSECFDSGAALFRRLAQQTPAVCTLDALDRSIDLRVSRLRKRLEENPQHARLIKTVVGAGYLFCAEVSWR